MTKEQMEEALDRLVKLRAPELVPLMSAEAWQSQVRRSAQEASVGVTFTPYAAGGHWYLIDRPEGRLLAASPTAGYQPHWADPLIDYLHTELDRLHEEEDDND